VRQVRDCRYRKSRSGFAISAFAFRVERVVNDEFALENFRVAQPELAEAARDPAQSFTGGVWFGGMRIGRAHNFSEQDERRIGELVFF
jgi:hypothetical protein